MNGFIDRTACFVTATRAYGAGNKKNRGKEKVFNDLFHRQTLIFFKKIATNVNITEIFRRNNKNRFIDLIRRKNAQDLI
ncbi:MAG: hypothetical protein ACI8P3_001431 [Saprospiraceae bacterium]|jgi:hypothetical protein